MDPQLLALLPDAAKLGILRHLSGGQPAAPPASSQQQKQQGPRRQQQHASVLPAVAGRTLEGGLAVIDGFLDCDEVEAARREAQGLLQQRARSAGMVAATPGQQWASRSVRGDQAAWLQGPAELESEGRPTLAAAVRRLAALQPWLAGQGHDVGGRPSFQLACYPGGGARYVRHRDASASVPYRAVTAILYLNTDWVPAHGGMLCIYNQSADGSDPCAASAADLRLAGAASTSTAGSSVRGAAAEAPTGSGQEGAAGSITAFEAAEPDQQQQQQQPQQAGQPDIPSGLDEGHPATVVPPIGGRLVVADSRLLHEIDSHMRFVDGWDTKLLRMLSQAEAAAGHSRIVLSTYPAGYQGEGPDAQLPVAPLPTVLCAEGFGADGLLRIRGRKLKEPLEAPVPALFWAAGLSFSRSQLIQEELLMLLRMWRAGWDVYTPSEAVAFHLWSRSHRPTFQQDHRPEEQHAEARRCSQQAVCAALAGTGQEGAGRQGGGSSGIAASSGSGGSAAGSAKRSSRSLAAFWEHTGVDFRERSISARARQGGLPPDSFLSIPEPWDYL
ncbi:hypothetical protein COHA_007231 [Chlorella ohadii]|uniref:Prolyl 4-hydroxylase alpha subunit Fe(2+) 2OG dioxygenase domain-containing protein n=1 Tax=Chlorella ohadii TaxID=2649997 RepID=A0AAD5DL90_9CHLO|nr:hypothetical protein COHA_007231 [Chlorella ohadii]